MFIPLIDKDQNMIRLNQVGYRPQDKKVAFITCDSSPFEIFRVDQTLVMKGVLKKSDRTRIVDPSSGDILWEADFSELTEEGHYFLTTGSTQSTSFLIGKAVYQDLTAGILKMFYYQRCGGTDTDSRYVASIFAHTPCHTGKARFYNPQDPLYGGVEADVSGGWHDAGDYGRYVSPAAKAVVDLLLAVQHFPSIQSIDFGGPERILDETRYEIEWLLKMQNGITGGVYHKVTTRLMRISHGFPNRMSPIFFWLRFQHPQQVILLQLWLMQAASLGILILLLQKHA